MKLLIALYFFILAIIQMGLFFGIYHYHRAHDRHLVVPSPYWMSSLFVSVLGLGLFGFMVLGITDVSRPHFLATIANTLIFLSALLQGLFYYALSHQITRQIKIVSGVGLALFFIVFEWMRQFGTFEGRTIFMCILGVITYSWQILLIRQKRFSSISNQLTYLQYFSVGELIFALGRIFVLLSGSQIIQDVNQIPQVLIILTIFQLVFTTLSYVAIGGYWTEQVAIANANANVENQEIRSLLQERETLIGSLMRANKTASTGALSASIAHELNQPLGASSLNIQFLQKKLSEGGLSPELQNEILATLLADNQRAATIIRSLRSIFIDEEGNAEIANIRNLIESVINIVKPELTSKNIVLSDDVDILLSAPVNASEISQVLLNLINNAIRALGSMEGASKKIHISASQVGQDLVLSVVDNGPGVPIESQAGLFELFSGSQKNQKVGMGLGLWLCSHIVTRHGGKIWHETPKEGGAKFVIQIPLG